MEIRKYFWTIGAIIYVLGMFPIFYQYTFQGNAGFGYIDLIAIFGAFVAMFGQAFAYFGPEKKEPERK